MNEYLRSGEIPVVQGVLTGFMAGEHLGVSSFGLESAGSGFATVTNLWGEEAGLGRATLCLAMIQLGNRPAEPGSYRVVGLQELDEAQVGDVLAVGFVLTLKPTERLAESGRPVYRLERVGEGIISNGHYELVSISDSTFTANLRLEGTVELKDREAPAREAFYRLLDADLERASEARIEGDPIAWEASQKAAFEAVVNAHFPPDMTPGEVLSRLLALRESVGEASAITWDPNRRSLIVRYDHAGSDGFIYQSMDFLFNEVGERIFFSTGSGWSRSAPRPFPPVDDFAALLTG